MLLTSALGYYTFFKLRLRWLVATNCFVDASCPPSRIDTISVAIAHMIIKLEDQSPATEIILIGHSVGAVFIPHTTKKIDRIINSPNTAVTLLTLGSVLPYTYLTCKQQLHDDLLWLSKQNIKWHDFSGKADALCFPETNPYELFKIKSSNIQLHDLKFASSFKPHHWKKIRRNKLLVHFLYFKQFMFPMQYNFFQAICANNTQAYLQRLP